MTSYAGQAITYDAIGNITSLGGKTYSWNGRQLESVTMPNGNSVVYEYNDAGLRTRRLVYSASDPTPIENRYVWNGEVLEAIIQTQGGVFSQLLKFIYSDDGEPLGFYFRLGTQGQSAGFFGEGVIWYVKNGRGDVIALMGGNELLGEYRYDAWGNMSFAPIPGMDFWKFIVVLWVATANPYSYRGYYNDYSTGMYYLKSRFYDPELGRFINADDPEIPKYTMNQIGSANLFEYCLNNPVMYTDPTGEIAISTAVLIGAAIGAVVGGGVGYTIAKLKGYSVKDGWKFWQYTLGGIVVGGVAGGITGYVGGALFGASGIKAGTLASKISMSRVRYLGKLGEKIAKISKNTKHIESINKTAKYRIPDILDFKNKIIGDVKYVKSMSLTEQLKDYIAYANRYGLNVILFVKPQTSLSKPLMKLIDAGVVVLHFITK